jgi:hypothetical protein
METKRFGAAMLFIAIGVIPMASNWTTAYPNVVPLTAEARDVYAAFLDLYVPTLKRSAGGDPAFVNVANRTAPLDLVSELREDNDCFHGITFENAQRVRKQVHTLDLALPARQDISLVNSAQASAIRQAITHGVPTVISGRARLEANLLEVSEIAFDATGRFAAIRYGFLCGQLCGEGGTVIFEKRADGWRDSHRLCLGWIA